MLLDLIDFSRLRRAILYFLMLAVLFLLQDHLTARLTIYGVKPMLIPAAVVGIGLFDGGLWGGFMGLAAGYFMDMGYPEHVCLFAVLFAALGFFIGVLGKYLLHRGLISYLVMFTLSMAVITFCQMFRYLFFISVDPWPVVNTGVVQLLWSIPWAIPVYFPCKSIAEHG